MVKVDEVLPWQMEWSLFKDREYFIGCLQGNKILLLLERHFGTYDLCFPFVICSISTHF